MATAIERLEELLDLKDTQLEEKDEEISNQAALIRNLEHQIEYGVDWMRHRFSDKEKETLPLPRLQMELAANQDYTQEFILYLVLGNVSYKVTYVPLGYSKRSGSSLDVETLPTSGQLDGRHMMHMPSLLVDGAIQMEALGLPLYVKLDDTHIYQATEGRPVVLTAI